METIDDHPEVVVKWLESPEGRRWSVRHHKPCNKWGEMGTIVPLTALSTLGPISFPSDLASTWFVTDSYGNAAI